MNYKVSTIEVKQTIKLATLNKEKQVVIAKFLDEIQLLSNYSVESSCGLYGILHRVVEHTDDIPSCLPIKIHIATQNVDNCCQITLSPDQHQQFLNIKE